MPLLGEARKAYNKKYAAEHKAEIKEYKRQYYQTHKEQYKQTRKRQYEFEKRLRKLIIEADNRL